MKLQSVLLIVLALILSACGSPTPAAQGLDIEVTDSWVRVVGGMDGMNGSVQATALFMTIQNHTNASDKLLKVESTAAKTAEIHLSEMDANGVSSMHPVDGVEIPAGGSAELKPGGYHVMLMGLSQDLKEGDHVTFTLTFQSGGKVTIAAPVKTP